MSEHQWYYLDNNEQVGPVDLSIILEKLAGGGLKTTDYVWRPGLPDWIPAHQASAQMPEVVHVDDGPVTITYAGFWRRFLAWFIDQFIGLVGGFVLGFIAGFVLAISGLDVESHLGFFRFGAYLAMWLYFALMESSRYQGTLGKIALGIKVTGQEGQRITFARSSGRFFAKILSALCLMIGFIMAGFTEKKQGLHDILAGCLVINDE